MHNNAENVKHILSTLDTAKCYIESLYDGIDFSTNVTRARFENEMSKVLPSLMEPIQTVLTSSGVKASDIDKVSLAISILLINGSLILADSKNITP